MRVSVVTAKTVRVLVAVDHDDCCAKVEVASDSAAADRAKKRIVVDCGGPKRGMWA